MARVDCPDVGGRRFDSFNHYFCCAWRFAWHRNFLFACTTLVTSLGRRAAGAEEASSMHGFISPCAFSFRGRRQSFVPSRMCFAGRGKVVQRHLERVERLLFLPIYQQPKTTCKTDMEGVFQVWSLHLSSSTWILETNLITNALEYLKFLFEKENTLPWWWLCSAYLMNNTHIRTSHIVRNW